MDGINEDPESPLNLSQSNNLIFYISRNHSLATKVDDVTSIYTQDILLNVQEGRTVLHWVCALGDLPKANAVLSIPGVDVNLQDGGGWTPLMIAGTFFLEESGWG
jgi:ankyrin repeat protein